MLFFVISTIVLAGFLDDASRRSRVQLLLTRTRFKLFALRDELRTAAIDGTIAQDNWFDYFDTTFTKMIDLLPKLSLWQITLLLTHYWDDPVIERSSAELYQFLREDGNEFYASLFKRYMNCMTAFLLERHHVVGWILKQLTSSSTTGKARKEAVEIVATAPETSTFGNYCLS